MGEWQEYTFGELLARPVRNGIYKKKEFHGRGCKIVNMGELFAHSRLKNIEMKRVELNDKEREKCLLKEGDLIFARRSLKAEGAGKCSLIQEITEDTTFESSIIRARPENRKANSEFLYYYFNSKYGKYLLGTILMQVAVAGITGSDLQTLPILLPPLPEQKTIASVLSSLDDKIDLLHRQNKTLEAMAETLFRQWFVEEARDDWEEAVLNDILSVKGGATPSTKNNEYWDGDIPWTTPRDLSGSNHIYLFDTERKITENGLAKISSGLLPIGTILLSSRASIGYLSITAVPVSINQGFIAILDDKGFSKYFIYLWVKTNLEYIISNANGSTFLEISKSVFKGLEISVPPADLRQEFDNRVIPIFQKIKTNSIQICTLEKLRDTLLPKLMSGEVRVEYEH